MLKKCANLSMLQWQKATHWSVTSKVATGYFEDVTTVILGGSLLVTALSGCTEQAQF